MTKHIPTVRSRKRLLLFSVLTAIILAAAWVAHFLITFDLNDYRQQAEARLSSLLSLPVKTGDIHYNIHDTNLALHLSDLQIGDDGSDIQLNAPEILINLQWWELLARNIKFAKISLIEPRIRVRVAPDVQTGEDRSQAKPVRVLANRALLQKLSIDKLQIVGGTLRIEALRSDQRTDQIDLAELNGELIDIKLNHTAQIAMKGNLKIPGQQGQSLWQLLGESALLINENNVLEPHFNLDLSINALDLSTIGTFFNEKAAIYSIEGTGGLQLHIEGSPNRDIDFQARLSSNDTMLLVTTPYTGPIQFQTLLGSGRLQTYGDQPGIKDLSLQIDESRLAGTISWPPEGQPFSTTITLLNGNLDVLKVKKWLPDNLGAWQAIRQDILDQGSIQIELAEFTLFENSTSQREWRIDRLKGELRQVFLDREKSPAIEIISLPFNSSGNHWQINNARGRWSSLQLTVHGTAEYKEDGILLMSLDFAGDALPGVLPDEWHLPQPPLSMNGKVDINGHLEGSLDQLSLDLHADLSQLSISHSGGLTLTPRPEDRLTVHATLSPQKISLDHGSLRWSVAKGHISGTYLMKNPDSLAIDALLTVSDMSRLADSWPLLKKLHLQGQAELGLSQRGLPEKNRPEIVLTLRDAGLRATRHIADLNQINGRVQLTPTGLVADNLRVHLGQSPLHVQARLEDFSDPRLFLDVKASSIRADELIFHSGKALLRDVDGHLEIDRDGLSFAPVDVRLDGGTQASVRGTISFHSPFDTHLDITSKFLRVDEVISLWANRSEASKKRSSSRGNEIDGAGPKADIKINALAEQGDLYGMSFHDASGLIVPTRERLSIHPLDFSVGEGFCNAQIITDFSREKPTLLRISGHAQDVDALEVYRELLNQKNIVRGKLRGDFYLTGEIGPNFLPSSYGNFSIQVVDGVLHQFPVLSKIFSLLNVSQIFALQLPDMDVEGMPFDVLSANFHLKEGVLASEDLRIQSEAMNQSYIGELDLIDKEVDFSVAIHPLGTLDKIISHIPVAGWLLTGEDKALLTAHFTVKGKTGDVSVKPMPLDTLTEPTIGLLRRTLGLPFKLAEDPQILWGGKGGKD